MNLGSVALTVLKTVAPTVALALGGPFGPLAAAAVHAALGTTTQADAEAALTNATPDQILALKKAENDFTVQMQQLGITRDQMVFSDLANARAAQVSTRDPTLPRLAWLMVGGFLVVTFSELIALMSFPNAVRALPESAWLLVGNVMGMLSGAATQVISFYFGSSSGSARKDTTIQTLATNAAPAPGATP